MYEENMKSCNAVLFQNGLYVVRQQQRRRSSKKFTKTRFVAFTLTIAYCINQLTSNANQKLVNIFSKPPESRKVGFQAEASESASPQLACVLQGPHRFEES
jgi:hypothetical protein